MLFLDYLLSVRIIIQLFITNFLLCSVICYISEPVNFFIDLYL